MKLTDNQRQILLKFVQEKHLTEKDFLHIENVSDEEGRWIISQAIMNYKKGVKVVGSVKQFNDFKEFISACSDYNDKAWEYAALACKTTQNFNRSHPMRMDLSNVEGKLNRINKRKKRGRRGIK